MHHAHCWEEAKEGHAAQSATAVGEGPRHRHQRGAATVTCVFGPLGLLASWRGTSAITVKLFLEKGRLCSTGQEQGTRGHKRCHDWRRSEP